MKKTFLVLGIAASVVLTINSCKSKKEVVTHDEKPGVEEVILPLTGREYQSNKEFFRAKNSGKSPDISTAKKIALSNAKAEIASNISSKIKGITDNYAKQRSTAEADDLEKSFETITREVVNQQLVDVTIIGEKLLKSGNSYEYWIAVEVSKDAVLNGIQNQVSKNKKLQIDYDKMKFEEKLNEEMSKLENEGNY